jgi:hypothetical protein
MQYCAEPNDETRFQAVRKKIRYLCFMGFIVFFERKLDMKHKLFLLVGRNISQARAVRKNASANGFSAIMFLP